MSVYPPLARPSTPPPSFPHPPSFASSPSKNRRPPPTFPPPSSQTQQPFASTSSFRFRQAQHSLPASLASPTTPAILRVSPPTPRRRARSADRGTNSPDEHGRRPQGPRQVYSGTVPSSRGRSTTSELPPPEYKARKMRELAPLFWKNVSRSDCTILVQLPSTSPVPSAGSEGRPGGYLVSRRDSGTPPRPASSAPLGEAFPTSERRGSAPEESGNVSVLTYHLHRDYLVSSSSLFRNLLSSSPSQSPATTLPSTPNSSRTNNPSLRARLVRPLAPSTNPTILLPLPDPQSFGLITHFLYWGNAGVVEKALFEGKVSFEGLVKNIEFLGLDNSFKIVCSRFWRKWIRPSSSFRDNSRQQQHPPASAPPTQTPLSLVTPPSTGSSSQPDSAYEQITPTSSTFPDHQGKGRNAVLVMRSGVLGESDDEEEQDGMSYRGGGYEDAELERRMRELGRRESS